MLTSPSGQQSTVRAFRRQMGQPLEGKRADAADTPWDAGPGWRSKDGKTPEVEEDAGAAGVSRSLNRSQSSKLEAQTESRSKSSVKGEHGTAESGISRSKSSAKLEDEDVQTGKSMSRSKSSVKLEDGHISKRAKQIEEGLGSSEMFFGLGLYG